MSELPYQSSHRRLSQDNSPSSYTRRQSQASSMYYNSPNDVEGNKSSYHSYQPQLQEKKIFGFQLFVNNDILKQYEPIDEWFDSLIKQYGVQSIKFNLDLGIPDLNGRNIQIFDQDMDKKYRCAKGMLHDVYQEFKRNKKQMFSIIIFVPQGMVSLLIGTKGHQINKIMRQSYTKIVVNQPINKMTYRTAKVQGQYSDIAKACKMIYEILEEKSSIAYAIEKQPSQFDYTKSKIRTKFLFPYTVIKYLLRKKKSFLEKLQSDTNCSVSYEIDKKNHLIRQDEEILVVNGRLEDVQAYIVLLINLAHNFMSQDQKDIDYTLKLLIPANYVTKLIGQKGYMIKDIIERSGGAQIKILSDRQAQRDTKQCIISINGTIENKIDASCFILEQIECFKNGGPILQSGKSINENLVQQFKNSIPIHLENGVKVPQLQNAQNAQNSSVDMDIENTNVNTDNSSIAILPPISAPVSPTVKVFASLPVTSFQNGEDKSEQEGLIEGGESDQEKKKQSELSEKKPSAAKPQYYSSEKSSSSRSRSRQRQRKKSKRDSSKRRKRSRSSSLQFKHDREYSQFRMIVPKKLAEDYRELEYIESLSKSKIGLSEQRAPDPHIDGVIFIKGCSKHNCKSIKLLQKRINRYRNI